jgi:3-hydroxy-9,10-secoandrosta-1,3,5(10)-triene-9,17-dione monooxygenase
MTQAQTPTRTDAAEMYRAAEALVPLLREQNAATEQRRWIGDEISRALNEAGIYRMLGPARYGCAEFNLRDSLDILTKIAEGCPSAAWVAGIHNAALWLGSLYSVKAQEEVFGGDEPVVVTGTLAGLGRLTEVEGGCRITGRWGFASGVLDSNWHLLGAPRIDGQPGDIFALVPTAELTIHKDWDVMGLAGTGSHSVEAVDVFVPEYRFIDPVPACGGIVPSEYAHEVPLFRSAFLPVLSAVLVSPALGAAKAMLATFLEQVPKKKIAYTIYDRQAESVVTQTRVAEAAILIEEAQFH